MTAAARATPFASGDSLIGHCEANFVVTAPRGPMSSPERLLNTLRQNLLPVLSEVLDAPEWQGIELTVAHIEIDLGDWPDDPVWSDVRYVFARKLRSALEQHLPPAARSDADAARPSDPFQTGHAEAGAAPAPQHPGPATPGPDLSQIAPDKNVAAMPDGSFAASNRAASRDGQIPDLRPHGPVAGAAGADVEAEASPDNASRPAEIVPDRTSQPRDRAAITSARPETSENTAAVNASLTDPEIAAALGVFDTWLAAQAGSVTVESILAHLAAHPAQVRGLILWQAATPVEAHRSLPAARGQNAVMQAAARLATHDPTVSTASGPPSERSGPLPPSAAVSLPAPAPSGARTPVNDRNRPAAHHAPLSENRPAETSVSGGASDRATSGSAEGTRSPAPVDATGGPKAEMPAHSDPPHGSRSAGDQDQRVAEPGSETGQDRNTAARSGRLGAVEPRGKSRGGDQETREEKPAATALTAEAPEDPALDQLRVALAGDTAPGRSLRAAMARLTASFQRSGLDENAATAASLSALVRLSQAALAAGGFSGRFSPRDDGTDAAEHSASPVTDAPRNRADSKSDPVSTSAGGPPATDPPRGTTEGKMAAQSLSPRPQAQAKNKRHAKSPNAQATEHKEAPDAGAFVASDPSSNSGDATPLPSLASTKPPVAEGPQRSEGQASAQNQEGRLRLFAEGITSVPASAAVPQLTNAFEQDAQPVFQAAQRSGDLAALAWLFTVTATPPRLTLLDPDQIRMLARANPAAMIQALTSLPQGDTVALLRHLLPPRASLLREQIEALQTRARAPLFALHQAAVALMRNEAVDIDALVAAAGVDGAAAPSGAPQESSTEPDSLKAPPRGHAPSGPPDETPLETVLALSGLTPAEIKRVAERPAHRGTGDDTTARTAAPFGTTDTTPTQPLTRNTETAPEAQQGAAAARDDRLIPAKATEPATGSPATVRPIDPGPPERLRDDATLRAHLEHLAARQRPKGTDEAEELLGMIWQHWPRQAVDPATGPASEFALLRARIAAQIIPAPSLAARLETALTAIEPDAQRYFYALRTVAARLAATGGSDPAGLHQRARTTVEALIALRAAPRARPVSPQRPRDRHQNDATAAREETLLVTEHAGLVLLHPFYSLLFDRMKIEREGKALRADDLPRALGALQFLAGDARRQDPVHAVLLGVNAALPLPEPQVPDDSAQELMTGLLRSVVDRWGRLGKTSPDGLRETFLRRTGSLRFEMTGSRLRVAPGPFDMLLDSLPWAVGPVALPWMPLPCHVSWRENSDA